MAEDKKSVGKCLLPNVRLSFPTLKNKRATVKDGKEKALGALIGPVMQASGGKANPQMVREILKRLILES